MISHEWVEVKDKAEGLKEIIDGVVNLEMTEYRIVDFYEYEMYGLEDFDFSQMRDFVLNKNVKMFQKVVDKFEE